MLIEFVCFSNLIKVLKTLHENIEGESEKLFLYIGRACYDVQRVWREITCFAFYQLSGYFSVFIYTCSFDLENLS